LKWAAYPSPGDVRSDQYRQSIEWLEERSNGRIQVNFFPAEQLYNQKEMLEAVRDGLTDIGTVNTSYFAGVEPIFGFATTASGITFDNWLPIQIDDKVNEKIFEPAFRRQNQHVLYGTNTGTQALYFVNKVRTLEDMKGLKLRAPGVGVDAYFEALGAVAVRISSPEVYMAAQRGTIDGCSHSITSYIGYKEYEPMPWFVEPYFGMGFMHMTMNLDVYNDLPDDLRKIVDDVSMDSWEDWVRRGSAWQAEKIEWVSQQPGVDYYLLPPDEYARWVAALSNYWPEWVESLGPAADQGQMLVDIMQKHWK
jgi:TRAP-type C4-dicarboxylate transport system substrate-binding protein